MRRTLEVFWGVVIVLVSATILGFGTFALVFGGAPFTPVQLIWFPLWTYGAWIGIRRIRGRRVRGLLG